MEKISGLGLLREPFPAHQISKLPKGSKAQNECPPEQKINCTVCGGWHHPKIIHLDYVGHAALTDRLLDADPEWSWEPVAFGADGLPAFDKIGGLWVRLTVLGVARLGYGNPDGKTGGNAIKEAIGDALRNAAMRFGAALDLWHKGDLHLDEPEPEITISPEEEYRQFCETLSEEIAEIKIGINKKDYARAYASWSSLGEESQAKLWKAPSKGGCFTTEERSIMKTPEFRASQQAGNQ